MNKEIHMAAECMLFEKLSPDKFEAALMKFAELVRADEREECAKVCESLPTVGNLRQLERATMKDCAIAIRARSNT